MTWQVVTADCLAHMRGMPDGSVDAVITDPPYGMSYQSSWRTDRAERFDKIANDEAPFVWFLLDAFRVLKDGGCLVCFCRWDTAEAFRSAIGWSGLAVKSQIIWDRMVHGMGDLRGTPGPRHDTIWFATKGKYTLPGKRPVSVLTHQRLGGDELEHPNEKPVPLMVELIESYVPVGGTVLDPFAGSGTTGCACVQTGRSFVGCELNAEYADIARRRCRAAEESVGLMAGARSKETT
jgi:DNA modification methylase